MSEAPPTAATATSLVRGLTLIPAAAIVITNVIGSGVFVKARVMMCNVGTPWMVLLAYAVAGVFTLAGALTFAELSALMPNAGGQYNFIGAAFGRVWAFLYGWMETLIDGAAGNAAIAIVFVRHRNLAAATEALSSLRARLLSARSHLRGAARIDLAVEQILERYHVRRYLKVKRTVRQEHTFKQARRGRPGPDTAYRRITRRRYDLEWTLDQAAVAYDEKSDGMYPLLSNDRNLTPAQGLEAHKGQPTIEKRFEQLKTVHEIAPVFLKNPFRIEAFFTLYFLALLVQALIERELRLAMKREHIRELPIYPEQRLCKRPTTEQILRLFSFAERHTLLRNARVVQVFPAALTDLQIQILLGVPVEAFRG